jgi:WD40 repeat protein
MPNEGNQSESTEQASEVNFTAGGNVTTGDHVTRDKITYNYYAPPPTPNASTEDESPAPGVSPFKGLEYFNEADADLFFGREALTAKLAGHLRHASHNFLAVVGASGSGKSSLVRAGLVPALKRGEQLADGILPPEGSTHWPIHIITPTSHPLEALAASLTRDSESVTATSTLIDDLARDPRSLHLYVRKTLSHSPSPIGDLPMGEGRGGGSRLLLVIDQFEELFTLCHNESERQAFVDNLLNAVAPSPVGALPTGEGWRGGDGPTIVVLTLRADFYAHCAQFADLREALAKQQEYIGPMSADELRRAIEEPAKRGDWNFEEGLVDLLLREVGNEPGALPLLSHALLETWKRRHGRVLTLKGYTDSGGVHGAIAKTAETIFNELTPEQQTIARNIFLRLTELGEGTQDTRRRAALTELIPHPEAKAAVEAVLKTLADARLITTHEETAEVAHEVLIREWPTLRRWLDEDREGLQIHRRLTEAAQEWDKHNCDESELYWGGRLSTTMEWAEDHIGELNTLEREFLDSSHVLEVNELDVAKKQAAQLRRRAFIATTAFCVSLIAAVAAGFFGIQSQQQARIARSRQLAAQAISHLDNHFDLALLLSMEAVRVNYTVEARGSLLNELQHNQRLIAFLRRHTSGVSSVAFSPDGKTLASGSDDSTIILWDVGTGQALGQPLTGHTSSVNSLAFSPDGKTLASGSGDNAIILWDMGTRQTLGQPLTGHTNGVNSLAFSPDGKTLASGGCGKLGPLSFLCQEGEIRLWDMATHQALGQPLTGHASLVDSVAFNPDGKTLASGSCGKLDSIGLSCQEGEIRLWDVGTRQMVGQPLTGHTSSVSSVAFSPDGKTLASGGCSKLGSIGFPCQQGEVILWDISSMLNTSLATHQAFSQSLTGHTGGVSSFAFSPDGRTLASGSWDNTIILWDVGTHQAISQPLTGHTSGVSSVAFSPDGQTLASGSGDKTIILWNVTTLQVLGQPLTGRVSYVSRVAFSPDGKTLASGSADNTIIFWDVTTRQTLGQPFAGHTSYVSSVAFSPDGKTLASGSGDNTIILWNISTMLNPGLTRQTLGQPLTGYSDSVQSVAFSPDGKTLASGSWDNTIILWDVRTGQALGQPLTGHTGPVYSVTFSPDGKTLASGSGDKTVLLWDVGTRQTLGQPLTGHTGAVDSVTFSPDGQTLASGSGDGRIILWDVAMRQTFGQPLSGHTGGVNSVAFSPDGKTLASGSGDKTIILWDFATRQALGQPLTGHTGWVDSVAFSPDGKTLASGSWDNTIILWDIDVESWEARACNIVRRNLTQAEWEQYLGHEPYHKTCEQWPEGE